MNIRSTKLNDPPRDKAVAAALAAANASEPPILSLAGDGKPTYIIGARAYRNAGLRRLAKAAATFGAACLTAGLKSHKGPIEGFALAVGSAADASGFLEDGRLTPGEVLELGTIAAASVAQAARRDPPVYVPAGPVDTARTRLPDVPVWAQNGKGAMGLLATVGKEIYAVPVTQTPFERTAASRDSFLKDLADAFGPSAPAVAAGLELADVLFDPHFWDAIDRAEPAPPQYDKWQT